MKQLLIVLILLLAILHQDFWWWDDRTVVFGFMPVGLAWHMGISIAAGLVGLLAVQFCWPKKFDAPDTPELPKNDTVKHSSGGDH